jgi:hypothetical protein
LYKRRTGAAGDGGTRLESKVGNRPGREEPIRMDAVSDADLDYAGSDSRGVNARRWPGPTSGDFPLGLALAGRFGPTALQERAVLVTEADRARGADPVGELDSPAAPRRDASDQRIAVIARMPRASSEQHRYLPMFVPRRCNGCASPHWRHDDVELPGTPSIGTENLSTVSRARVEKNFGRWSGVWRARAPRAWA